VQSTDHVSSSQCRLHRVCGVAVLTVLGFCC